MHAPTAPTDPVVGLRTFVLRLGEALTLRRTSEVVVTEAGALARARRAEVVLVDANAGLRTPDGSPPERRIAELAGRCIAANATARDGPLQAHPLLARNRIQGALILEDAQETDARYVETLATQAALALDRALFHETETTHREELEESESRFRSLVQELDAVFWECDPTTFQFSFVSERAERLLGYPTARWLEPGFWASVLHPEDQHWALDFCVECTREGRDHAFEYRMLAADGRVLWFRDVVYVLRDAEGRPSKLRGVMLDITHERDGGAPDRVARRLRPKAPA